MNEDGPPIKCYTQLVERYQKNLDMFSDTKFITIYGNEQRWEFISWKEFLKTERDKIYKDFIKELLE